VSSDQDFVQGYFQDILRRHNIDIHEQGASRHNKTEGLDRSNYILKDLIKLLIPDIQSLVVGSADIVFTVPEIVSQSIYFKILQGANKMLSAFEQSRGYQPPLCGLHIFFFTPELVAVHDELAARRALARACSKRNFNVLSCR
jgi:hypothetical protein